jgi:hypothetical protein
MMTPNIKNLLTFLILYLCVSVPVIAEVNIAASAEETKPMKAGEKAPDFTVYNVDGSPYHFQADNVERTTVLITFRGGWCPLLQYSITGTA